MSLNSEFYIKQINDRGGITIPPEIRKYLNLKGDDHISFKINKTGNVEISKIEIREINPQIKTKTKEKIK